jgi:hypothetical protein
MITPPYTHGHRWHIRGSDRSESRSGHEGRAGTRYVVDGDRAPADCRMRDRSEARKLVTTFKERVTIFLDKPRLLIPMGADHGAKMRTPFRPENSQSRAAECRRLYPYGPPSPVHTPRKTPRNRVVLRAFDGFWSRFSPFWATLRRVGARFYQPSQSADHRGRGSAYTTPPQPFPARPLACRAA